HTHTHPAVMAPPPHHADGLPPAPPLRLGHLPPPIGRGLHCGDDPHRRQAQPVSLPPPAAHEPTVALVIGSALLRGSERMTAGAGHRGGGAGIASPAISSQFVDCVIDVVENFPPPRME